MGQPQPYGVVSMRLTRSYSNGWTGEIVYCLSVDQVDAHIQAHYQDAYPGTTNLHVSEISDEPWMDGDIVRSGNPGVQNNNPNSPNYVPGAPANPAYSNSRKVTYRFALDYLDVPWPSNIPRPAYLTGTTLKLTVKYSGQYLTLPAAAMLSGAYVNSPTLPDGTTNPNYVSGARPGPSESPARQSTILIPLRDYVVEWDRVQDLGQLDFSPYAGRVNTLSFMGGEPGTLLCQEPELEPTFVLNPSNPNSLKVKVTFRQRRITVGNNVYGWNDEYTTRTTPPGWGPVYKSDKQTLYATANFSKMFL